MLMEGTDAHAQASAKPVPTYCMKCFSRRASRQAPDVAPVQRSNQCARLTPDRHTGRKRAILAARQQLCERALPKHPARWSGTTRGWTPVSTLRMNPAKGHLLSQERDAT